QLKTHKYKLYIQIIQRINNFIYAPLCNMGVYLCCLRTFNPKSIHHKKKNRKMDQKPVDFI
ncbi:MAG: hypothetical protein JXB49_22260, partial [Bacteroidales bacterium]|nr:hypothetical protein [Bacteroidales bacterium]